MNRLEDATRDYLRTVLRFPEGEVDEIVEFGRLALARAMSRLMDAVAGGDARRMADEAHGIKGMLRNMGLSETAALAGKIGHLAQTGALAGLPGAVDELRRDLSDFLPAPDPAGKGVPGTMDSRPAKA